MKLDITTHVRQICDMPISITITDMNKTIVHEQHYVANSAISTASFVFKNPHLWWPNGLGDAYLYKIVVTCGNASKQVSLGVREFVLDQSKDQFGSKFQFVVNNVPVFSKGANWIPADIFHARVTSDQLYKLVKSAALCAHNSIRIWGGGIYESDAFYDLCDQHGLLIWHDCMFACSMYPANASFLQSVEKEIQHQVRRLQHHPSIVIWAGNNENEEALLNWDDFKNAPPETMKRLHTDYKQLYIKTIYPMIQKEDPLRVFWPSSPSNGIVPEDEEATNNPQDLTRGDVHYWRVWHGGKPFTEYQTVTPRFCSEFGFQSLPSMETLAPYISTNETLNLFSPEIEFRQRSYAVGNKCILEHMGREFRIPGNFAKLCYVSQILQAKAIRMAVEHWRRQMKDFHCAGAICKCMLNSCNC